MLRSKRQDPEKSMWVFQSATVQGQEATVAKSLPTSNLGSSDGDSQSLWVNLTALQLEMRDHGNDIELVALAEVVMTQVLKYVQNNKHETLEDTIRKNFLIDPDVITKRKPNKDQRNRDHKLQVLFRIELHWLLASQEYQKKIEDEMLDHLRKISIWDEHEKCLAFLKEIVTPFYEDRQPELLVILYDNLDEPPPPRIRALFSPSKKSEASR